MSKRNLFWLAAVVAVGIVLWVAVGWLAGVIGAVATLVVSEVVERAARRRRGGSSPVRGVVASRRSRSK